MVSFTYRVLAVLLVCATASMECNGSEPAKAEQTNGGAGSSTLDARIQELMRRPEFQGARWGMKFYSPDTKRVIYSLNSDQLLQPASAMKVFVAGTAFVALGPDYRFHTTVYRTGPVEKGILKGDLVLVASGDLLLGGRVRPDGQLALPEPDHTYALLHPVEVAASEDPLRSVKEIAAQIAACGIKRVEGSVLVDASLFREDKAEAGGTGKIVISPMMIHDNLVDVVVTPGSREGEAATLRVSPETAYVKVINKTTTTAASDAPAGGVFRGNRNAPAAGVFRGNRPGALRFIDDVTTSDGSHTVTLTGNIPLGSPPLLCAYSVPEPVRFAEVVLAEALQARGITANVDLLAKPDFQTLSRFYTAEHRVAELVSPPLCDEVKPMLKLSSNPHTLQFPYVVGAIAGHEKENARSKGMELQQKLFEKAGMDPAGAKPSDQLGRDKYSADAFIQFLTYMSRQPYFPKYLRALPIMGKDGSLAKVQASSPVAGHVYAKTGTAIGTRLSASGADSGKNGVRVIKALAGYIELPDGRFIAFAEFLEMEDQRHFKGLEPFDQVMGQIASAVYESLVSRPH
jgi:D-alanyl-D-alanine carboxypeptidase/D-alanyl-D-alanine-endopeptidase (penicillin-binding protein 4)